MGMASAKGWAEYFGELNGGPPERWIAERDRVEFGALLLKPYRYGPPYPYAEDCWLPAPAYEVEDDVWLP